MEISSLLIQHERDLSWATGVISPSHIMPFSLAFEDKWTVSLRDARDGAVNRWAITAAHHPVEK